MCIWNVAHVCVSLYVYFCCFICFDLFFEMLWITSRRHSNLSYISPTTGEEKKCTFCTSTNLCVLYSTTNVFNVLIIINVFCQVRELKKKKKRVTVFHCSCRAYFMHGLCCHEGAAPVVYYVTVFMELLPQLAQYCC